jgi:hypothetical protein
MPNNPNPIPTSTNLFFQQLIITTANNPFTINAPAFVDPVGEFFRVLKLKFLVKSSEKNLQLATFSRHKDETFKMLYKRFLQLKEDTQSITNLEATHQYLHSLEDTPTLHAQVLQRVFVEFRDSYNLLDVYNIFKKMELAHAHYEASITFKASASTSYTSQIITFFSRAKTVHSVTPIVPSCNCCGNPADKGSECNIPSKELFCDYFGKEGH